MQLYWIVAIMRNTYNLRATLIHTHYIIDMLFLQDLKNLKVK